MENTLGLNPGDGKKLPKPNNIIPIVTTPDADFFTWWCTFLRPFVSLSEKEVKIVACFLRHRWELSKRIQDPAIVDTFLMGEEVKQKIIKECNMTLKHLYVVMSNLRKHGIIVNNVLNPRIIPNIRQDDNGYFQLLILFKNQVQKQ